MVKPDAKALANAGKLNHLFELENIIRKLVPKYAAKKCRLTATVGTTGDIVVVLEAVEPRDTVDCLAASRDIVSAINTPKGVTVPGLEGTLLPAVATEVPNSPTPSTNGTAIIDTATNTSNSSNATHYDNDGDVVSSASGLIISTVIAILLPIFATLIIYCMNSLYDALMFFMLF